MTKTVCPVWESNHNLQRRRQTLLLSELCRCEYHLLDKATSNIQVPTYVLTGTYVVFRSQFQENIILVGVFLCVTYLCYALEELASRAFTKIAKTENYFIKAKAVESWDHQIRFFFLEKFLYKTYTKIRLLKD